MKNIVLEQENQALKNEIRELKFLVKYYEELFKLSQKRKFGISSEKSLYDQLTIEGKTDETAVANPESEKESSLKVVKEHHRKKRTRKEGLPKDLPIEEIIHELSDEEKVCPHCDTKAHLIGNEIREELVIEPAKVSLRKHITPKYKCRKCEDDEGVVLIKANAPNPVIKGSFASPEAVQAFDDACVMLDASNITHMKKIQYFKVLLTDFKKQKDTPRKNFSEEIYAIRAVIALQQFGKETLSPDKTFSNIQEVILSLSSALDNDIKDENLKETLEVLKNALKKTFQSTNDNHSKVSWIPMGQIVLSYLSASNEFKEHSDSFKSESAPSDDENVIKWKSVEGLYSTINEFKDNTMNQLSKLLNW